MSLTRQAKTLSKKQEKIVLTYLKETRHPIRNRTIFLLSIKAGLRAKEISYLKWSMCTDPQGNVINTLSLYNQETKRLSGRKIPLNKQLLEALILLKENSRPQPLISPVICSERGGKFSPQTITNFFYNLYQNLEFDGCSSHSGRRTFITRLARNINGVGGSLRDVQTLAGHTNLQSTQRYIDISSEAIIKVMELI